MKSIDLKLWRDLWAMKGQALAIALVIAGGISTFIMSRSTLDSLKETRATFYRDYRFAEVFVSLKRAPESLRKRIREISGVDRISTAVIAEVKIELEHFSDPVTGSLVSSSAQAGSGLNTLYLRAGRFTTPGRADEVVVSEAFAEAHAFKPGDRLTVIVNGRRKHLHIVGIALSPAYIYQIAPGAFFPDFERYAVLWMERDTLSAAIDMSGAFNQLSLTLSEDAALKEVIDRLDTLLQPYGGLGAYGRQDQLSHRLLDEEFRQLEKMAIIFPIIFLGVAAFLLNVVVSRIVGTQREQIAILKAFGYSHRHIALHYIEFVILIVCIGAVIGLFGGIQLGQLLGGMYMEFYRFPFLEFTLRPPMVLRAILVAIVSALLGTFFAVRKAALLPPAEAMRPEPPTIYRETLFERMGLKRWLGQPSRMIARHIERRPVKSLLSVIGIALACAIMMVGSFQEDAIDFMVEVQFGRTQREDISISFAEATAQNAINALENISGVNYAEPFRTVPVRLHFEHRSYLTAIRGSRSGGDLQRLLNTEFETIRLPDSGILLTAHLGKILGLQIGDKLDVEVLTGNRVRRELVVTGFVKQYMGVSAYMELTALNRLLQEGNAISGAFISIDKAQQSSVFEALKTSPKIVGTIIRESAIQSFNDTMAETLLIFTFINTLLASTIAFGVVYNSARIMLSERSRELASLRVLGLTRGEISYIMLGELGVLTFAAIPLGFLIGGGFCDYISDNLQTDLYRVPLILEPSTYGFAATVVLISAVVSGLIVRRNLDHLDLVAVLKTKE